MVGPDKVGLTIGALTKFNLRAYARKLNFDLKNKWNIGTYIVVEVNEIQFARIRAQIEFWLKKTYVNYK